MKTPLWLRNAYRNTSVSWAKSQANIYRLLGELGIYEIRFTNLRDKFVLEFLIEIREGEKPRGIRIIVPLKENSENENQRQKELNIIHRILFNHLKAKFVAIQSGLTEFEEEFMAHLIITNKDGDSGTMGEMLLPQYRRAIESGNGQDFKLLEKPKGVV